MRPGETVSHYEILAELGGGGMGVVFSARDLRLGRQVAIKFLSPELLRDPNSKSRFVREARAASALEHPNICTVHDVDETPDGHLFLVMARYEGETLRDRIDRGPLRLAEALRIAAQIARGLAAAHGAGIVHRDIKPANIMLPKAGEAKILDFGLAKLAGSAQRLTRSGTTLGTLAYMAPEQARTGTVDARSDLWAVGAVLYEMVTGRLPFEGEGDGMVLYSILERDPPLLSTLRPGVSAAVEDVVARLLEKEPERRFADGNVVADALENLASGVTLDRTTAMETAEGGGAAGPRGRARSRSLSLAGVARAAQAARRRRVSLLGAATMALVVAGLAVGGFGLWRRNRAERISTLAVLPFVNLTGDPQREYLVEGISSVLIQQLSALRGLNVVGRSETWAYKGQNKNSRTIARELGVGAILEGQVLRVGDLLRVQASLIDASSGFVLWSRPVEGAVDEILGLQEQMAREISQRLAPELSGGERATLERGPTTSPQAYDLYLRALQILDQVDNDQRFDLARSLLERALQFDQDFALARAELSETLAYSYFRSHDISLLNRAETEARGALRLDTALPEARIALARVLLNSGRGQEATDELRVLVAQNPSNDAALSELAEAQTRIGDFAAAEASLRQALALRPTYWFGWNALGSFQMDRTGDYDAARQAFLKARELAPPSVSWPSQNLATLAMTEGDFAAAVAAYERVPRPIADPELATNIGTAYFYAGRLDEVEEYYRLAIRLRPTEAVFHANLGDLYVRRGERERARSAFAEAAKLLAEQLKVNPEATSRAVNRAAYLAKAGNCPEALAEARRLHERAEPTSRAAHRFAQVHALCGEAVDAIAFLRMAIDRGYAPARIAEEDEFQSLTNDPEFRRLIATEKAPV